MCGPSSARSLCACGIFVAHLLYTTDGVLGSFSSLRITMRYFKARRGWCGIGQLLHCDVKRQLGDGGVLATRYGNEGALCNLWS
jgi:hypothetical protein